MNGRMKFTLSPAIGVCNERDCAFHQAGQNSNAGIGQQQFRLGRVYPTILLMALLRCSLWLTLAAMAFVLAPVLAACSNGPRPTPASSPAQTVSPPAVSRPVPTPSPVVSTATPPPSPTPRTVAPAARPSPSAPLPPTASPLPSPPPPPLPLPTPRPGNSDWVRERIDAVVSLYRPTLAGEALLRSLDLRQMQGEPGFFGSYGFEGWAGVGEAKPIPVMHELGHSYWGGFPVIGRPQLTWERQDGDEVSQALASYHRDILAFMAQPPDDYEFLRERLRNLPEVSGANTEPLLHAMEADVPYTTGGDLFLLPPLLRKYWGHFLAEGPFGSWDQALGWFQSLTPEERVTAGKFLGFEHFDLRQYPGLPSFAPPYRLLDSAAETLAEEERQRLTDLAEQFDLLLGDARLEEDFQFWRGYLQDKVALFRSHPGHLESLDLARAGGLSDALLFLSGLEGGPEQKAETLTRQLPDQPFLVNFLPAVDDRTLVELFAADPELPEGPTLQATASFVERLQRFAMLVDDVVAESRESPQAGARALEDFLSETGYEQEQDLRLFFDLLKGADGDLARQTMGQMDKPVVRALMVPVPVQLRAIFRPEELLDKLDITSGASDGHLRRGITLLIQDTSGNYRIDEPFLERLYTVMAERVVTEPMDTLRVMTERPFPIEGMILRQPGAAAAALSGDIQLAAALVKDSDPVLAPPARIIHRLIFADPSLAAKLVTTLYEQGESLLVTESLAYFAYDKARSDKYPQLPISVAKDGEFLESLLIRQGDEWLTNRLAGAMELYEGRVAAGEVPSAFLRHYRDTLQAAADSLNPDAADRLADIIRDALG